MRTHKYFTLEELTRSSKADKLHIDNTPTREIECHLCELMDYLDVIREAWGSPIVITSGYRCEALNKAVGGSATSVHTCGWAADMHPSNGKNKEFLEFVKSFLKENNMAFDQLISEYPDSKGVPSWIHLGLRSRNGAQRKQVKTIK